MLPAVPEDNCVIQPALKPATDRLHSTTECQLGPGAASIQEETLHSSAAHAACVRHQPCLLHKEHTSPVFSQPVHLSAAHASCICHNQHSNRPATGHNPARTYNTHNTPAQRNERADAMRAVHHATSHDNTQITIHACSCRPRLRATSQLHSLHAGCSLSEWHKAADWPKITAELAGFAKACPHPTHCISCKVQTRPNRHAASPQLTPAGQRELERCSLHLSVHCMDVCVHVSPATTTYGRIRLHTQKAKCLSTAAITAAITKCTPTTALQLNPSCLYLGAYAVAAPCTASPICRVRCCVGASLPAILTQAQAEGHTQDMPSAD